MNEWGTFYDLIEAVSTVYGELKLKTSASGHQKKYFVNRAY